MNKNRKIKRGVTAGIAAGMSFLLGALPVCAADTSVSKEDRKSTRLNSSH